MKVFITTCMLMLCCWHAVASNRGVTLNEAVNQVKSEGRVLSAKTINGHHEIKVLTPGGTVKTINKQAAAVVNPPRPEFYNRGGRSMRDRKQNPVIPNRFSSKNQTRDNSRHINKRQMDAQSRKSRNRAKSSTNNKDKDK